MLSIVDFCLISHTCGSEHLNFGEVHGNNTTAINWLYLRRRNSLQLMRNPHVSETFQYLLDCMSTDTHFLQHSYPYLQFGHIVVVVLSQNHQFHNVSQDPC